jgi:glycosyltransferase involved in cell wall biosynthesis
VTNNYLHIVTHDVPYPADFGGVVDIFYKIKALHAVGIKINLHCFIKNRPEQIELEKYCETVTYYKRKGFESFSLLLPYIVSSRKSKLLLANLQKDNYPILFEGVHSTYYLHKNYFINRKTFLRLFNVEHIYYDHLSKHENSFVKKMYYKNEAQLLKKYEASIANKTNILTLSTTDLNIYTSQFAAKRIQFLPAFLANNIVASNAGIGNYCLYHGNLSINENEKAALWLIENVFAMLDVPFIIAGKNPSLVLKNTVNANKHVTLIENPADEKMQELIADAQINVLPSFNNTGVKLKLLNVLYSGRHCIVNAAGVDGSELNSLCIIAETAEDFKADILFLMDKPFAETAMQRRNAALNKMYNNEDNALLIHAAIQ